MSVANMLWACSLLLVLSGVGAFYQGRVTFNSYTGTRQCLAITFNTADTPAFVDSSNIRIITSYTRPTAGAQTRASVAYAVGPYTTTGATVCLKSAGIQTISSHTAYVEWVAVERTEFTNVPNIDFSRHYAAPPRFAERDQQLCRPMSYSLNVFAPSPPSVMVGSGAWLTAGDTNDCIETYRYNFQAENSETCFRRCDNGVDTSTASPAMEYGAFNVAPFPLSQIGNQVMATWPTQTANTPICTTITFASPFINREPYILVSGDDRATTVYLNPPNDGNTDTLKDAAIVWAEQVTASSFRACYQERLGSNTDESNAQQVHAGMRVNWLALLQLPDKVNIGALSAVGTCQTASAAISNPDFIRLFIPVTNALLGSPIVITTTIAGGSSNAPIEAMVLANQLPTAATALAADNSTTTGQTSLLIANPAVATYQLTYYPTFAAPDRTLNVKVCSLVVTELTWGRNLNEAMSRNEWRFYQLSMGTRNYNGFSIVVLTNSTGDNLDVFLQQTVNPGIGSFYAVQLAPNPSTPGTYRVAVDTPAPNSRWRLGVRFPANAPQGDLLIRVLARPYPPSIGGLLPSEGPTTGGTSLVLTGFNFGPDSAADTNITVGGKLCTGATFGSGSATCNSPAGQGANLEVVMCVFAVCASAAPNQFSYLRPNIQSVSPTNGPTAGDNVAIVIGGSNFGTSATVKIGTFNCPEVPADHTHFTIKCLLQPGQGVSLPIEVNVTGQTQTYLGFTFDAPHLDTLNYLPDGAPGAGGTLLTINGRNFGTSGSITVGGNPCFPVTSHTHVRIICTLPAGQGTANVVQVTVSGRTSDNALFLDYDKPYVNQITPLADDTPGGRVVTILGSNFGAASAGGAVYFGGTGSSCAIRTYTNTNITCTVPAGQGRNVPVYVSVGSQDSNSTLFNYNAPVITGANPPLIGTQSGAFLTLQGRSFGTSSAVTVNNIACTPVNQTHFEVVCRAPAGQGLNNTVSMTVSAQPSNTIFISRFRPSITRVDPSALSITDGGSLITLVGANFGLSGTVTINGGICTTVSGAYDDFSVQCLTPAGQGTNATLIITVSGQTSTNFTFAYLPPFVRALSPPNGPTGGSVITIQGDNFGLTPTASMAGSTSLVIGAAASYHRAVPVTIPVGRGIGVPIRVTVGGQVSNANVTFAYDAPLLTGYLPSTANTDAVGVELVLSGSSLDTDGQVTVNGVNCTKNSWDHSLVRCQLPAGQGTVPIQLRTADNRLSNVLFFTYAAPSVIGVNPTSGATVGGYNLTVTGTSLGLSSSVAIGGRACVVLEQSHSVLKCRVPPGQGRNNLVVVTVPALTGVASSNVVTFDYQAPVISYVTPSNGPTLGNILITVVGTSFGLNATVSVNGADCPVVAPGQNHTAVVCRLPAGQGDVPVLVAVGGQLTAVAGAFSYNDPVVQFIRPALGMTGDVVTMVGFNFGTSGGATIGGNPCTTQSLRNHTHLACQVPAGVGTSNGVQVTIGSKVSNLNVVFAYRPPWINGVVPSNGPTQGTTQIVLSGTGFGPSPQSGVVSVGPSPCTPVLGFWSDTSVTCLTPAGTGKNQSVQIVAGVQSSNLFPFDYDPPTINNVVPNNGPTSGVAVVTGQPVRIVVRGSSFGNTPGFVFVGANPCVVSPASDWTATQITCRLPEGQGIVNVTVVQGGQVSTGYEFRYDIPSITPPLVYTSAPTAGGSLLTVNGANFGTLPGTVTVGGRLAINTGTWGHALVIVRIPAGEGLAQNVVVNASNQFSVGFVGFNYDAPTVDSVTPGNGPTAGNVVVTVRGNNYGTAVAGVTAFIGGRACTALGNRNHTYFTCTTPVGVNQNNPVAVVVQGQANSPFAFIYDYDAPILANVSGCVDTPGVATTDECPLTGTPVTLLLAGVNFGLVGNASVTVAGAPCTAVLQVGATSHTTVRCALPAGSGFAKPVVVRVGTQDSNSILISYQVPVIFASSLRIVGGAWARGNQVLPNTGGGQVIEFFGKHFLGGAGSPTVVFGTATAPSKYACVIQSPTHRNDSYIKCTVPAGVGIGLQLIVNDGTGQLSPASVDTLSYPLPLIVNGTITSPALAYLEGRHVPGTFTEGEPIAFKVRYAGNVAADLTIFYGLSPNGPFNLPCTPVTVETYDAGTFTTRVQCTTQPGSGTNLYNFQVTALNGMSIPGNDTYAYPVAPVVTRVRGCGIENADGSTSGCPTPGVDGSNNAIRLTIEGSEFVANMGVKIGDADCTDFNFTSQTMFTCRLPAGAGALQSVIVNNNNKFSRVVNLVNYAPPVVTAVTGCTNQGATTVNCARLGGVNVTLTGTNFGNKAVAFVMVAGETCTGVVQDPLAPHTRAWCLLPAGTELNALVTLVQGRGSIASQGGRLSYTQCALGFYQANDADFACTRCANGTFSATTGQTACTACPAGRFMFRSGAQSCDACPAGTFSPQGASNCTLCPRGTFASLGAQSACAECATGTFSNTTGRLGCDDCPLGRANSGTRATSCTNCTAGQFAAVTGLVSCNLCPAGKFASGVGAQDCALCPKGKFFGSTGASQCTECLMGQASSTLGQPLCQECDAGFFSNATGLVQCYGCTAGKVSVKTNGLGAQSCSACPVGQYMPVGGQSVCLQCGKGTATNTPGSMACAPCPAGSATDVLGTQVCANCTAGSYSTGGAITCSACPAGLFTGVAGLPACAPCATGKFSASAGLSQCANCTAGLFAPGTGNSACTQCGLGTFSQWGGAGECTRCLEGTAAGVRGRSFCDACGPGSAQPAQGQSACQKCDVGTFSAQALNRQCTPCAIGTFSGSQAVACTNCTKGSIAATPGSVGCQLCGSGSYAPLDGLGVCTPCPAGSATSGSGSFQCGACGVGKAVNVPGQANCVDCVPGTFANASGLAQCLPCEPGWAQTQGGQSGCAPCPAGTGNPLFGQQRCAACPVGTATPYLGTVVCGQCPYGMATSSINSQQCTNCTKGAFSNVLGALVCLSCPVGRFSDQAGTKDCTACAPGYQQPGTGAQLCDACLAGKFQPSPGQGICIDCPSGQFSNGGASNCTLCAPGTFTPSSGASLCLPCQPGRAAGVVQGTCDQCLAGFYAPNISMAACAPCPAGKYQPRPGSNQCLGCAPGSAHSLEGLTVCPGCSPGTYAGAQNSTACEACATGTVSAFGAAQCTQCLRGEYQPNTGQQACLQCPVGTYGDGLGADECTPCSPGQFADQAASQQCSNCTTGKYAATPGTIACAACLPGTFAGIGGLSKCRDCPAGSSQPNPQAVSCTSCIAGKFSASGQAQCLDCAVGSFSTGNAPQCSPCLAGTSQPETGMGGCVDCVKGQYQPQQGQAICLECDSGRYSNDSRALTCAACSGGTTSSQLAGHGAFNCLPCDAGKYSALEGQARCLDCPLGTSQRFQGMTVCADCLPGEFADQTGLQGCNQCLEGSFTPNNATAQCKQCEPGTFQDQPHQTECVPCAPGTFSNTSGNALCTPCGPGSYQQFYGQVQCLSCPIGKYMNDVNASVCTDCEPGRYQAVQGQLSCLPCPVATYTGTPGQFQCLVCPVGTYNNETGQPRCPTCPPGQINVNTNQTKCFNCAIGFQNLSPTECTACPPGRFGERAGQGLCTACPRGRYQNLFQQLDCIDCIRGEFSDAVGQVACRKCAFGSYAPQPAQQNCTLCEPGRYVAALNATDCLDCPRGFFAQTPGQFQCEACLPGSFSNTSRTGVCTPCYGGTYNTLFNATVCLLCLEGEYSTVPGQIACTPCPPRTAHNMRGIAVCPACVPGKFQNTTGQTSCIDCSIGKFTSAPGQDSCNPCGPGTYGNQSAQANCVPCPAGQYGDELGVLSCKNCSAPFYSNNPTGASFCLQCEIGKYTNRSRTKDCDICEAGKFSTGGAFNCTPCAPGRISGPGSGACQPCPSGTRTLPNVNGASACVDCLVGEYQPGRDAQVCLLCPAGKYSNANRSTDCLLCPPGKVQYRNGSTDCDACPAGYFQGSAGQTNCTLCPLGRYTTVQSAAEQCLMCIPGQFQNSTGAFGCLECPAGTFSSEYAASNCTDCTAGKYAVRPAAPECTPCLEGKATNRSNALGCDDCPLGKYQNLQGESLCKKCEPGRFAAFPALSSCIACQIGKAVNVSGSINCTNCAVGSAQSRRGQATCLSCARGFVADQPGLANCRACRSGKFMSDVGGWSCYSCEAGKYSLTVSAAIDCSPCIVGTYSPGNASYCTSCPVDQYAPRNGSAKCSVCPREAVPNPNKIECDCVPGFYRMAHPLDDSESCAYCPPGPDCDSYGSKEEALITRPGWWRNVSLGNLVWYRCLYDNNCAGGLNSDCGAHREGPICSNCVQGYHTFFGGVCQKCVDAGEVYLAFIIIICLLVYALMNYALLRGVRGLMRREKIWQITLDGMGGNDGKNHMVLDRDVVVLKDFQPVFKTTLTFKMKIVVTFLQITTNLGVALEIPWPTAFKAFVSFFSIANFDIVQASNLECVSAPGDVFYKKFIIMAILPLVMTAAILIGYTLPHVLILTWFSRKPSADQLAEESRQAARSMSGLRMAERPNTPSKAGAGASSLGVRSPQPGAASLGGAASAGGGRNANPLLLGLQPSAAMSSEKKRDDDAADAAGESDLRRASALMAKSKELNPDNGQRVPVNAAAAAKRRADVLSLAAAAGGSRSGEHGNVDLMLAAEKHGDGFWEGNAEFDAPAEILHVDERLVQSVSQIKRVKFALWRTWYKTNRLILFSLFLIYPVVSSTILRLFVCKNVNGVDYLQADFHNVCYDDRWHLYAGWGIFLIILYPVGIPILFAVKLTTNRLQMQRPGVKAALGFFYGSFYPSAWWFELVDITHKLILTSIIAFFPPDLQLPFAMTFIMLYMIIILLLHPYKQITDDLLHLQAQIALFLYIYAGFMLQRESVSEATNVVLSIILIGLLIFLLLFAVYYFARAFYGRYKDRKTKRAYEQERLAIEAGVAEEEVHGNVKHIEMNVLDRQGVSSSALALGGASALDLMSRQLSAQDVVRLHGQQKSPSGMVFAQIEERERAKSQVSGRDLRRNSLSQVSEASVNSSKHH